MKLAIMQPYFLPYLGYFQLMAAVDKFVIYDDVNFITRHWINRNRILLNGREHLFTAPLVRASQNRLICEMELVTDGNWRAKLTKTIAHAYQRAPQFNDVFPIVCDIVCCPELRLSAYLLHGLATIKKYLGIAATLVPTSTIYRNRELKGQDRILDICRREGATVYVNPPGGRELYDPETFRSNKIALRFLESPSIKYRQFGPDFFPALSIVDVLMFNPADEVKLLLSQAELKP